MLWFGKVEDLRPGTWDSGGLVEARMLVKNARKEVVASKCTLACQDLSASLSSSLERCVVGIGTVPGGEVFQGLRAL